MQRVLVTGGTGLLGNVLVPLLEARGNLVLSHSRSAEALGGDLSDVDTARRVIAATSPDCIINLAALTNVDECERDPQRSYLVNTKIVENIVAVIRQADRKVHLIQISTDQLYDGEGPHAEAAVCLRNVYAFSKYASELATSGISSTVLRTNFFGRSATVGRISISDWLVNSLSRHEKIKVFTDVLFSPLSINVLSEMICRVANKRICGVFNLGSKDGSSKADFCYSLAEVLGLPVETMNRALSTEVSLRAYRPKDMRMDSSAFELAFDIQLPTLQHEIESMAEFYHARR